MRISCGSLCVVDLGCKAVFLVLWCRGSIPVMRNGCHFVFVQPAGRRGLLLIDLASCPVGDEEEHIWLSVISFLASLDYHGT